MLDLKFRIGTKLMISAAAGVALVAVMIGNEQWSNAGVEQTNAAASALLTTQTKTLLADGAVRGMQIFGRDMRLARNPDEIGKALEGARAQQASVIKYLEEASRGAGLNQGERFARAMQRINDYGAALGELATARNEAFKAQAAQTALSVTFTQKYEAFLAQPILAQLPAGAEIGTLVRDGALDYSDARIAMWRFLMTGTESYLPRVRSRLTKANDLFKRAAKAAVGTPLIGPIDELTTLAASYLAALDTTLRAEAVGDTVLKDRAVPARNEADKILQEAVAAAGTRAAERTADASAAMTQAGRIGLGLGIIVMLVVTGSALFSILNIARPIRRIGEVLLELAGGNKAVEIPYGSRSDEVGDNARAAQTFKDNLVRMGQMEAEQKDAAASASAQRRRDREKLADDFQATAGAIIEIVSSTSTELAAAANTLTKTADLTQSLSGDATSASDQASANVQSVASAAEEMSSSVNEIGRQVQESTKIANEAVEQARRTDARINDLSQAAGRIGDVVKLITAIAEQTNLLALNATIEAARAGEAGKGFAVVASEVKQLASQTAKATEEISTQIASMQTATQESVGAIKEIGGTIGRISEIAAAIATAVEEQGAATGEISRNVAEAARGTSQVAANIAHVNRGASETGSASAQVLSSAQSMSGESNRLKLEVDKFLSSLRAA